MRKRFEDYRSRLFASEEGGGPEIGLGTVGTNKKRGRKRLIKGQKDNKLQAREVEVAAGEDVEKDDEKKRQERDDALNSPTLRAEMEKTRDELLATTIDQPSLPDGWEERVLSSVSDYLSFPPSALISSRPSSSSAHRSL